MTRAAWAFGLLLALFPLAPRAQELVIFHDYRSLQVQSHRADGRWTYLRLSEGELAVLTATIREFRKEGGAVAAPASALPASAPAKRDWKPEPPPPSAPEPEPVEEMPADPQPEPPMEEPPPPEEAPPPPPPPPPAHEQVRPFGKPDLKRATIGRSLS